MWIPIFIDTEQGPIIVNLAHVNYCMSTRHCKECPGEQTTTIVGHHFEVESKEPLEQFAVRAFALANMNASDNDEQAKTDLVKIRNPWRA